MELEDTSLCIGVGKGGGGGQGGICPPTFIDGGALPPHIPQFILVLFKA